MKVKDLLFVILPIGCAGSVIAGDGPCPALREPSARRLIETTCSDVRQKLAELPESTVGLSWGSFLDSRFGCTREGCVVRLSGRLTALGDGDLPDSWLADYLEGKGWSRTLSHDADGPDGTTYALHQPGALCIVEGRWSHWHDDAGEGHTGDSYALTVSCGGAERRAPRPPP